MGQVVPKEGDTLNYRIINFASGNRMPAGGSALLEIAIGDITSEGEFDKQVYKVITGSSNRIIGEVPFFGKKYTWRFSGKVAGGNLVKGSLHHFSTGYSSLVDTTVQRLRILKAAESYDGYVFLDNQRVLYDMKGRPVWYLPAADNIADDNTTIRDLKITRAGTITFIGNKNIPFEVNCRGNVLWHGPNTGQVNGERDERYHHEFTRLSNGHYMVLGTEVVSLPVTDETGAKAMSMCPMSILIEYDHNGKVIWTWKTSKYFKESDLKNYTPQDGARIVDLHENAFFFDEAGKTIYLSYKNISRIIKIKYPEGNVVATIGAKVKPGQPLEYNGLFCGQHACKYSQIGCLFLFNNNGCNSGSPKIKILKEDTGHGHVVKKIWEYDCLVEDGYPKVATSGGNVQELPDHSAFVSMAGPYSKVFIVNMDKQEMWSALPEKWVDEEKKWAPVSQYRASVCSRAELEKLISGGANSSKILK